MPINIKFLLKITAYFLTIIATMILVYGISGWLQARKDAPELRQIVQDMKDNGLSAEDLGADQSGKNRAALIIKIQDPNFFGHSGYDLSSAGAGATTITQSVSKRLAFVDFKAGYQKIRQTGYAIGLESILTKDEIFILFLNTVQMGRHPTGWIEGFHSASRLFYRLETSKITDEEFIALISVMIAPAQLRLDKPNNKLVQRIERVTKLIDGKCEPNSHNDVWLDGCAS